MELFYEGLALLQRVVQAFGLIWLIWGLVILGIGIKDKTAPDIKQGFGHIFGAVLVILASELISRIQL